MKLLQLFRETRMEMKHVVWPSRTRAIIYGLVVIIFSVGLGYLLGGFDELFRVGLKSILF